MAGDTGQLRGQNEHYIGSRLSYSSTLDDADNSFGDYFLADILKLFLTITFMWWVLSVFVVLPLSIVVLIMAWILGALDLLTPFGWLFVAIYPLLYIALWLFPSREFSGRWELSFDGVSGMVEPVTLLTFQQLQARRVPAGVSVRRQQHAAGEERFYIVLTRGEFRAYISSVPFGTDLYVTWAMWRHRPPILAVVRYASDLIRSLTGRGAVLPKVSRNDPERALREVIHDSVRAGVEEALAGQTATVEGTFGSSIVIDEDNGPTFDSLAVGGGPTGAVGPPPVPHHVPAAPAGSVPPGVVEPVPGQVGPELGQHQPTPTVPSDAVGWERPSQAHPTPTPLPDSDEQPPLLHRREPDGGPAGDRPG